MTNRLISIICMGLCLADLLSVRSAIGASVAQISREAVITSEPNDDQDELPADSAQQLSTQQQLFIEAESAARARRWADFSNINQKLNNYILSEYLQRDYLIGHISNESIDAISHFLIQYGSQPVTRKLRYKWLFWLAENQHTSLFLTHYQDLGSRTLRCYQLDFRLKTREDQRDLDEEITTLWLSSASQPKACDALFANWKKQGGLNQERIWQRLLLATKAKNTRLSQYLINQLSNTDQGAGQLLLKLSAKPQQLEKIDFRTPLTSKANDIINFALQRLAWNDPNQAITIWKKVGEKYGFTPQDDNLKRAIALSLALDKDTKASDWLNTMADKQDESIDQWILSTAISQQNWDLALTHTRSMAEHREVDEKDKWLYWQAVALTQLGQLESAKLVFESVAPQRSYYGFLAARQLNLPPQLADRPVSFTGEQLETLARTPAALRANEFYRMGRLNDARREWNQLVATTGLADQIKLAALAHQWGWQHQAILAFARSKHKDDLGKRFPLEHLATFQSETNKNQIPLSWAFAVTRQESAFKTDAVSGAGARGLMQLTPATAKQVARDHTSYHSAAQLFAANTNIELGTAHLGEIYREFNNHPILATAAYNAGKRKVKEWLENASTSDPVQWIEQIPYKETREYVKNVLAYQLIYAKLTDQQDAFITQLDKFPIKQVAAAGPQNTVR